MVNSYGQWCVIERIGNYRVCKWYIKFSCNQGFELDRELLYHGNIIIIFSALYQQFKIRIHRLSFIFKKSQEQLTTESYDPQHLFTQTIKTINN